MLSTENALTHIYMHKCEHTAQLKCIWRQKKDNIVWILLVKSCKYAHVYAPPNDNVWSVHEYTQLNAYFWCKVKVKINKSYDLAEVKLCQNELKYGLQWSPYNTYVIA